MGSHTWRSKPSTRRSSSCSTSWRAFESLMLQIVVSPGQTLTRIRTWRSRSLTRRSSSFSPSPDSYLEPRPKPSHNLGIALAIP